jgi:glycosyltransferase involved in cell wall biosynthesis
MAKISVIIPTYNGEKYISQAINSVLAQTYKDYEIIVVDDGSTDATWQILGTYGQKIRTFSKPNGGPGSARNLGIRNAAGSYLAFLDQDDEWLPDRLAAEVDILDKRPEVALVFADANICSAEGAITGTTFSYVKPRRGKIFKQLYRNNFIANLTVLVRKSCFVELGELDQSGRMMISDDYNMWLRIAAHYPVEYVDRPLARYRIHQSNLSLDLEKNCRDTFAALNDIDNRFPDQVKSLRAVAARRKAHLFYLLAVHFLRNQQEVRGRQEVQNSINACFFYWRAQALYLLYPWKGGIKVWHRWRAWLLKRIFAVTLVGGVTDQAD